jgi:ferredoxin
MADDPSKKSVDSAQGGTRRSGLIVDHCGVPAALDDHGCIRCGACGLACEVTGTMVNVGNRVEGAAVLQLNPRTGWVQLAWPFELRNGRVVRWYRAAHEPPLIHVRDVHAERDEARSQLDALAASVAATRRERDQAIDERNEARRDLAYLLGLQRRARAQGCACGLGGLLVVEATTPTTTPATQATDSCSEVPDRLDFSDDGGDHASWTRPGRSRRGER